MAGLAFRRATLADAPQLLAIRREAILVLAPRGMPAAKAEAWAAMLTLAGMEQKLRALEIWVAESCAAVKSGTNVSRETECTVSPPPALAWGAIQDDYLSGLYVSPEHAGAGIGTALLVMLEGLMRTRGHGAARTDASENAESFYLHHGYVRCGAPNADDGLPMIKVLKP